MLTDAYIKSLKVGDKKRHTDRDGLVLELRPTKKKLNKVFIFRFQWNKKPPFKKPKTGYFANHR